MKTLLSIFLSVSFFFGLTLPELRTDFENASKSSNNVSILYNKLDDYSGDNQTIIAYKDLVQYNEMLELTLINNSIKKDSKDVENRLIRLIVQENIPKFIKYNQNIQEDKTFIVENYSSASKEVKTLVKSYAKKYNTFTAQQLKKLN